MKNASIEHHNFLEFCKGQLSPLESIEFPDSQYDLHPPQIEHNLDNGSNGSSQFRSQIIEERIETYESFSEHSSPIYSQNTPNQCSHPYRASNVPDFEETPYIEPRSQLLGELEESEENETHSGQTQSQNNKKRIITVLSRPDKKPNCNCRKTNCLKLYCDCLAQGKFCGKDCSCEDCKNNPTYVEIKNASYAGLNGTEISKENIEPNLQSQSEKLNQFLQSFKGCNCKKSRCEKKYCECYSIGILCTKECHCNNCKNISHKCSKSKQNSGSKLVRSPKIKKMKYQKQIKRNSKIQAIKDLKEKTLSIREGGGVVDIIFLTPKKSTV